MEASFIHSFIHQNQDIRPPFTYAALIKQVDRTGFKNKTTELVVHNHTLCQGVDISGKISGRKLIMQVGNYFVYTMNPVVSIIN
jgi:hypothetical protein